MLQKKEKGVDGKLGMYPRVILQFFLVIFNQMGLGNHRAEGENFLTPPKNRPSVQRLSTSLGRARRVPHGPCLALDALGS